MTMTMLRNKYVLAGIVVCVLVVANIISYIHSSWGLITVKVTDAPIGQVIKSIERQGWVTIYSNIDPQTKISMYVDHVPLPDAMESLAQNSDAQWRLAYFVAPTSSQVKEEIRTFTEGGDRNDDTKIYSFMTPLEMISNDSTPIADPRLQTWPGMPAVPAPAPPVASTDPNTSPADAAADGPPTSMQGYLRAFAQQADIWIMAPAAWDPPVSSAPAPSSSITSALGSFVSDHRGSVDHALILRGRPPRAAGGDRRPRGFGGGGGFRADFSDMEDRMRNAINGLPAASQADALSQLDQEVQFQKQVKLASPDDRRKMMMQHMIDRRMEGDNSWRRSPEKRAQMFTRLVSNRMTAQGRQ